MTLPVYLADGVYLKEGSFKGELVIYCSNGVEDYHEIYMDQSVREILLRYLKAYAKELGEDE